MSIGCASSEGKAWIHSAGKTKDQYTLWDNLPEQDLFLESMAYAAAELGFGNKEYELINL